jgi:anti-anti-sigma factor
MVAMVEVSTYRLRGEVDLVAKCEVAAGLAALIEQDVDVVVDCADVTFIDSSGVGVLVDAEHALAARGRRLRVVNLHGAPRRAFEVLGLVDVLGIDPP